MRAKTSIAFASVLIGAVAALSPANAACKKFGFTVNDYGKDGPTNDAKNLLDKHVAEWASKNGVSEYSTGKKNVSCELFLDVILFDEHTCTASATVCWGPDAKKFGTQSAAGAAPAEQQSSGDAPPAPVRKAHALGEAAPQQAAAPAPAAEAPAADTAQIEAAPTQPVEQIAAPAEMPAAAPAVQTNAAPPAADATSGAVVETGALQAGQGLPQAAGQQPAQASAAPNALHQERAAAAAAAASAAAAAERAAIAAETAANAAKEAAAAAVAASAASKGGAKVAPLDHASGAKPVHAE